ncbi:MAG: response regulator [Steroidobacteraceae bacterium]
MTARNLRIFLVEDHPVLQEVLREFVCQLAEECRVLPDAAAALAELEAGTPDLMLVDLSLPGMDGIELIKSVRRSYPYLPCANLSGQRSQVYVAKALVAGANAHLLKGDPVESERGIKAMLAGNCYLSEELRERY